MTLVRLQCDINFIRARKINCWDLPVVIVFPLLFFHTKLLSVATRTVSPKQIILLSILPILLVCTSGATPCQLISCGLIRRHSVPAQSKIESKSHPATVPHGRVISVSSEITAQSGDAGTRSPNRTDAFFCTSRNALQLRNTRFDSKRQAAGPACACFLRNSDSVKKQPARIVHHDSSIIHHHGHRTAPEVNYEKTVVKIKIEKSEVLRSS